MTFSFCFATDPITPYCFIPPDSHLYITYITPVDICVAESFIIVSQMTFYFWHSVIHSDLGKNTLNIPTQLVDLHPLYWSGGTYLGQWSTVIMGDNCVLPSFPAILIMN